MLICVPSFQKNFLSGLTRLAPVRCLLQLTYVAGMLAGFSAHAENPHWAFVAPSKASLPAGNSAGGSVANPIDSFLDAQHAEHHLRPQPAVEKHLLLRRVYLDLIGLPPTRADLAAFLADPSPAAFERVVDRLLLSPQHAERWARHWMDVWRYCDWYGLEGQLRYSQKHLWHWRDWIIDALRDDKGYDQMIREMLAGDEIAPADPQVFRATGFLARNYYLFNRDTWLENTIEHTVKAFLGLTFNCAKCHDHKTDPITQRDYYSFRAFFEPHQVRLDSVPGQGDLEIDGIPRVFDADLSAPTHLFVRGDERTPDKSKALSPSLPAALGFAPLELAPLDLPREAWAPNLRPFVEHDLIRHAKQQHENFRQALAQKRSQLAEAPHGKRVAAAEALLKSATELIESAQRPRQIGDALDAERSGKASTGFPLSARKALTGPNEKPDSLSSQFPKTSTGRRLALAQWITDGRNPLTARVAVNHVWMRHFGEPLVPSVFDFGLRSPQPPNHALLDWLAVEFIEHGWSLRHLHRLVVTSQAYQRSSSLAGADPTNLAADPDNRFFWRYPGRRMEAEVIRDTVLYLAGELDLSEIGGPTVPSAAQDASRRRSLYFARSQEDENQFLLVFDQAKVLECYRREESIVPQQALAAANSRLLLDAATRIALRVQNDGGDFIGNAFQIILCREPTPDEHRECQTALVKLTRARAAAAPAGLMHVLLNHNDFVSIR
ncbi:MAG: DUF1549 and DUF1553 domain-containing protein [Verrucomicrobiales bacterium]